MNNPVKKLITTITVTIICMFVASMVMIAASTSILSKKQKEVNEMKAEALKETLEQIEMEQALAVDEFYYKTRTNSDLMAAILKNYIVDGKYSGQLLFEEGMVVKNADGKIEQPTNEHQPQINVEELKKALIEPIYSSYISEYNEEMHVIMTASEMAGGYYYVDWTSLYEFSNFIQTSISRNTVLSEIERVLDGALLVADNNGDLYYKNSDFDEYSTFDECGIDLDNDSSVRLKNTDYSITYVESELTGSTAILLIPFDSYADTIMAWTRVFFAVCVIIIITMIVWNYAVQQFVFNNVLSEEQEKKYHPKRVRNINIAGAVTGVIVMLLSVSFVQSMSNLYAQAQRGRSALNILDEKIKNSNRLAEMKREDIRDWYIYYGNEIADAVGKDADLLTKEKLEEFNDIVVTDYLIAYDENGNEVCSSGPYVNLSLGTKEDDPTTDFRRLLHGLDYIDHDVAYDKNTGKTTKLLGVKIPFENRSGYGALIMGINPNHIGPDAEYHSYNDTMKSLALPGDLMMIVDKQSGVILGCSDPDYCEHNTSSYGIDVGDSADSLMNHFMINGNRYYGLAEEAEDVIYFDFLSETSMTRNSFGLTAVAAILFLMVYAVSLYQISRDYTEEEFTNNILVGAPVVHGSKIEIELADGRKKETTDPTRRFSFISQMFKEMMPENKAALAFDIMVCFALLEIVYYVYIKRSASDSLLGFIMQGSWSRGFNLFALTSIVILVAAVLLGMMIIKLILYFLISITDTKGETICRLIYNLLQYVALITILYYAFGYLGFNTNALLASVGFVTLAISLGSKDLVTDILAGLTIVFEGEYQVGDMVEIAGYRGKVQEIGVRSTKLIGRGDNIKIISNRDVRNVVNMTRLNSWLPIEVTVSSDESLERVEEILDKNLPEIGKKIKEIIRGPYYYGVLSMNKGGLTLSILTECKEENYHRVQRKLNKELINLFNQNNIPMA